MKKYLLILMVVLAVSSMATAASATFRVAADDVKPSYIPSDTITIELVADFYVAFLGIDYIYDSNSGTASNLDFHHLLIPCEPPIIVNSGGTLFETICAMISGFNIEDGVPIGEVVLSFEYHFPDVPDSTIIEITAGGVVIADAYYMDSVTSIGALQLHVDSAVCPTCPGDISGDNQKTLTDYYMLRGKLNQAYIATGLYVVPLNDPCVGHLYDICGDMNTDDQLTLTDYYMLRGQLGYAYVMTNLYIAPCP